MAIFGPLTIGRDALLAHQRALQTTGHNIANVDTPGYSRQRAVLNAVPSTANGIGGGVRVVTVEQLLDPFLEARRLATVADLAGATTGRELLARVQEAFPVDAPGIGSALAEFFAAAEALATHPQDLAARTDVLTRAEALAAQLRGRTGELTTLQRESDTRVADAVQNANGLIDAIARLNRQIVASEIGGQSANDLRDTRREALAALAQTLDVRTLEHEDGAVSVFAASGAALVLGPDANALALDPASTATGLDGAPLATVGVRIGGDVVALGGPLGGTLGALVAVRDQAIPAHAGDLDLLATTLRDAVNAVQTDAAGRDLDGLVGTPLFAGTGAADLSVVLDDPRGLAVARSANLADNGGALALAALGSTTFAALGGATFGDFAAAVQSRAGAAARAADDEATVQEHLNRALDAQREAVSAVSIEEEFLDLIRAQRAFQAASQLIVVGNAMLDDLFGIVR